MIGVERKNRAKAAGIWAASGVGMAIGSGMYNSKCIIGEKK